MSKVEAKAKEPEPEPPQAKTGICPKCNSKRYVEEHGMKGTKHCPDCGHWAGLKEWAEANQ